jgi:hypothetical protein
MFISLKNTSSILFFASLLLLSNCAKVGEITGGEKDSKAPKLEKTIPADNTTRFNSNEITLIYDEYIKLKDVNLKLNLNPKPKTEPNVSSKNESVFIKNLTLKPNTTYLLQNTGAIVDFSESNAAADFSLIFSTGDSLDHRSINGTIKDYLLKPASGFTVFAFELDSGYTHFEKSVNQSRANKEGYFNLRGMKPGCYHLIALEDMNSNFEYESFKERIGFLDSIICITHSDSSLSTDFNVFLNDQRPFELLSFKNQKIYYELVFNKSIFKIKSSKGYLERKDNKNFKLYMTDSTIETIKLYAADSFGYSVDTTLFLTTLGFAQTTKSDTVKIYPTDIKKDELKITFKLKLKYPPPLDSSSTVYILRNTLDSIEAQIKGFEYENILQFSLALKTDLDTSKILIKGYQLQDIFRSIYLDTIFGINSEDKPNTGTLSVSRDSTIRCGMVGLMMKDKIIYPSRITSTSFQFFDLNTGDYQPFVFIDRDQSGYLSPGDLSKKKQPEKLHLDVNTVKVRPGWDVENYRITLKEGPLLCE